MAARSDSPVKFTLPGAPVIAAELDRASGQPFQHTHSLYWSVSTSSIRGVVEKVRTALAELAGEILARVSPDQEELPKEAVDQAVTFIITGERARVDVTSSQATGKATIVQLSEESVMGDNFSNVSGSTIVNRSLVANSLNHLQQAGSAESAEALRELADVIEESGSREAAECLDNLNEELAKDAPRKAVLRAMWERILVILPYVANSAAIATGIGNLVN